MGQLMFLPTLSPAYGRDYESAKAVCAAVNMGKDFSVGSPGGPYIALGELLERVAEGQTFNVRYAKLALVCVLRVVGKHVEVVGDDEELSEEELLGVARRMREGSK